MKRDLLIRKLQKRNAEIISSAFDENDVNLTDLTELNLIDVIVSPHYCEEEKLIINDFKKKSQYEVVPLSDRQALLVIDEETKNNRIVRVFEPPRRHYTFTPPDHSLLTNTKP